jgi:hypothetical protein
MYFVTILASIGRKPERALFPNSHNSPNFPGITSLPRNQSPEPAILYAKTTQSACKNYAFWLRKLLGVFPI